MIGYVNISSQKARRVAMMRCSLVLRTYRQFFLLGSNDFTIPKYWLASANPSLSPPGGATFGMRFGYKC